MLALPLSLEGVGEVLGIERKKLKEGGDLVRYPLPCDQRYCIEDMRRIVCELYENGGVG